MCARQLSSILKKPPKPEPETGQNTCAEEDMVPVSKKITPSAYIDWLPHITSAKGAGEAGLVIHQTEIIFGQTASFDFSSAFKIIQ